VGGASQDARVKNALDNAYRAVPAAKSPEEAALGYIDIQNSLNQKQDQALDQQNKTNQQQTKQINDLVNDMRRKENDFRNLNAQIASMPNVTPQQAARMAQDIEAAHNTNKDQAVDVPNVVAKQTAAQPAKTVAAPGPGASVSQLANYQQAKDQGAATAKTQPAATQATPAPAPAVTPPGRVIKGKNQSDAIGQMTQQLTAPPAQQELPAGVGDLAQARASKADKEAKALAAFGGQKTGTNDLEEQAVPSGAGDAQIAAENEKAIVKAYIGDTDANLTFLSGPPLKLKVNQVHALVDAFTQIPNGMNKDALKTNLFSNRSFLIEWMFENVVNPATATNRPTDVDQNELNQGQLALEGDVVPMTDNETTNQAYADALIFLKRVYANPDDPMITTMRQDFAHKYQQRFQISQAPAPDRSYYLLDKQLSKKYKLPTPDFKGLEEEPYDGKSDWSDGKGQWSSENNLISSGNNPMGFSESADDIKKRMSKLEALALAANRAGDDAKCKMYQQKIQSLKQKLSQSMNEFDASGYDRYSIYMDDYDLKEKFSDLDDAIEAIEAYKRDDPKSRYADYNVRDLNGKVVWRNDAWQDVPKPGKIQFLPRRDQGMAESAKPGEYYIHTVYFKDGTKKRVRVTSDEVDVADYYNKRGQAVDRVDYDFQLHSDMSESISKKDLIAKLTKDLNSNKFKNTPVDPNRKDWTGAGKDDYGYTGYQGHGMPTDKQERDRIRADKKKGVAEGQVSDNVSHRGDVDTTANIEVLGVDLNNDTFKITYNGKPYTIKIQYFSKEDLGRWQIPDYEIDVINAKGKNIIDLIDWDNWENDRRFNMVNTTIAYLDTQHAGDIQLMAWRQVGIENRTAEALYQEIQDFYKNNKQQLDKATAWLAQNIEDAEERQVFADFVKNPVSTPAKTKYIPKEYLMYVAFSYSREGNTEMTPGMNLPTIKLTDPDDEDELYRKVDELFRKVQFKFDAFENKIVELADSYGLGSDPDLESGFGQRSMFWDHKTITTSSSESNKNRQQILAQGILKFQAEVEKYVAAFNNTLIKIGLPGIGEYSTWSGVLGDQLTDQQVRYFATPEGFANLASGKIDVAKMIDDNVAKQGLAEAGDRVDPILIRALERMPDGLATHGEVLNAAYDAYAMELGRMEMKSQYGVTRAYIPQLMDLYKNKYGLDIKEAQTDYSKRRRRYDDVEAGRPVKPLPKNPQTDYAKKRAKEKRDLEQFGETTNYWTRLQNERNTKIASLVNELKESIEKK
jgi:hypothetical protein